MKQETTFTLEDNLVQKLNTISKETSIPRSELVEKMLENLTKEYEKKSN
ncbi:ribbon-helix-helix domain-containing protein [Oenococcus sp. UCMA 16435]|nr:ribbon-helix-helix domain-containing protein [Oenococcus sp. UCMA 16435]MDI4584136.1 ribbon-helix-helix domain-containing protein [Oenococcus sp. UCMA 14587]MDN6967171.1 ribbon-helix-helix domain-containing protein [Oenococcus sp. UCMA 17063]